MRTLGEAMMVPLFRLSFLVAIAIVACTTPTNFASAANETRCTVRHTPANTPVREYHFDIRTANYSVSCHTKEIVTVNGKFPGPTIYADDGDRIRVIVTNKSPTNMTIHFHGTRQVDSPWMDGVAGITMCPIAPGDFFVHDFLLIHQQGTLLWHAHIGWQRATVHGAFITRPTSDWNRPTIPGFLPPTTWYPDTANTPYPFQTPAAEFPVILAEWWNEDVEEIEVRGIETGGIFPTSDAVVINGHPGPHYNCSSKSNTPAGNRVEPITTFEVGNGKTYLLQIVNAATNMHLFFAVANHTLTVVEADGEYVQPLKTSVVFLSPGQTASALITADQKSGIYYMSVSAYGREPIPAIPAALFKYSGETYSPSVSLPAPVLPALSDTAFVFNFTSSLRTLYLGRVPLTVNRDLFMAVGLSRRPCNEPPVTTTCNGTALRAQAAINNITFAAPQLPILQASFFDIPGIFTEDFPDRPEHEYNYTAPSPPAADTVSQYGTRIIPITFNDTVQIVLQNTAVLGFENHPFHLHGHNFYELGQGLGNYNAATAKLNLVDPALRNTVSVPTGGWASIRFKANNPGVWLFHCHLDKHTSWGMQAVFHIRNGIHPKNKYNCPPERLTPC